ncbi:adhesion G-protein coupled receptor G5-like isoform X2 [Osmerus eperlanus]|uniref:adhesion G-protein coupled receptor G5-like isoform X2 n=1 Tax=Osmerus eperlanus TaxID=29151 RepID=UPI002E130C30
MSYSRTMRRSSLNTNIFGIITISTTFLTFVSAVLGNSDRCENVLNECLKGELDWTGCFEDKILTCRYLTPRFNASQSHFKRSMVNSSKEVEVEPTSNHKVHIPALALQKSMSLSRVSEEVLLVVTILPSSLFRLGPTAGIVAGGSEGQSPQGRGALGETVLAVKITGGVCVFWKDHQNGTGYWSTHGCNTTFNDREFVCSCDHLSFFAVLVNPGMVDPVHELQLSYITYVGSTLSVLFTTLTLVLYTYKRKGHLEHSVGVHVQLNVALLCLHLFFLVGSLWAWLGYEGRVCEALGLLLHYSLLATFSWMAIEGFHLYLLLVRVFNIYIRRYLLKLCLVGWGVPTVVVVIYGSLGAYGRYSLYSSSNSTSDTDICWLSSEADWRRVSSVMVIVYLGLVLLFNCAMLGVVLVRLCRLRGRGVRHQEGRAQLWKDWATVLGLSCVLGIPWVLAFCTYGPLSLPGNYLFTVFNSMQGIFLFLWFLARTRKSHPQEGSSFKDPSTQKMDTTTFN